MKKKVIIILVIISVGLITIYYFFADRTSNARSPKRPLNIPEHAEWIGGTDGGDWYEIVKVTSSNSFRIKIYGENSGELEMDAIFRLNTSCIFKQLDSISVVKNINAFDGQKILLTLPGAEEACFLEPEGILR